MFEDSLNHVSCLVRQFVIASFCVSFEMTVAPTGKLVNLVIPLSEVLNIIWKGTFLVLLDSPSTFRDLNLRHKSRREKEEKIGGGIDGRSKRAS